MLFGVPGLKRILVSILALVAASGGIISCGGSYSAPGTNTTTGASKLKFRAFISNPLFPGTAGTTGANLPVLNIVNAATDEDVLSASVVSLVGASAFSTCS